MNHLSDSQLNEYLDHALTAAEARQVEAHLHTCRDCQIRMTDLQHLFSRLMDLEEVPLPRDLAALVLNKLPHQTKSAWTPALAAQLGAVLGVLAWLSWQIAGRVQFPNFRVLQIPPWTFPAMESLVPAVNLSEVPVRISLTLPQLTLSLPNLPALPIAASAAEITAIGIASLLIWLAGNVILLRGRTENGR